MPALLLLPLLAAASAGAARAPAPIRTFVERRAGCNHWAGEDAYDAERGREIARALRRLRCDTIDAQERVLKRRFARDAASLRLLESTRHADGAP